MADENEESVLGSSGACNGGGIPERRHSSTEGGRGIQGEVRLTVNRRHSLGGMPSEASSRSSAGCVIDVYVNGRDGSPDSTEVITRNTATTDLTLSIVTL